MRVNVGSGILAYPTAMSLRTATQDTWFPISIAPVEQALELCVIEGGETCVLVFPCEKVGRRWVAWDTQETIDIDPTHWRSWANPCEVRR